MTHARPLRVASAFPDPPFEVAGARPTGFDHDLVAAIAAILHRPVELHRYDGPDFDGIFAGLGTAVDVVASGATVTDHRRTLARWCDPYVRSGQSLVVNSDATPDVHGVDDLHGAVIGVQKGNTSEPVARRLHAEGKVADVQVYAYEEIAQALDDLEAGTIGGFMKLEPVLRWLTRHRPRLRVVESGITDELLAMAVALDHDALAEQINAAQRTLVADGRLTALGSTWFADSDPEATRVVT